MKLSFSDIKNFIKGILTSPVGQSINSSLGRAAAIGGFILSFNIFIAPINNPIAIDFAIYAPVFVFLVLSLSECIKTIYLKRQHEQLQRDKAILEGAAVYLNQHDIENNLQAQFAQSYQQIIAVLNHAQVQVPQEELTAAIDHQLDAKLTPTIVKYSTGVLDLSASAVGGAATIFINFIIPTVLNDKFGDQDIRKAALVLAIAFAIYTGMASIATTSRDWKCLDQERADVRESLNRFYTLYSNHPGHEELYPPQVRASLNRLQAHQ